MKLILPIPFRFLLNLIGAVLLLSTVNHAAIAENFTQGAAKAIKFGTHEIVLTGNGSVPNPFDTVAQVAFRPLSGSSNAVTVHAFDDGNNLWRARLYVSEAGRWTWTSSCAADGNLNPKLMERGNQEFLIYHPNAATDNKVAQVDTAKTARLRINLKDAPNTFQVEWFRAYDGAAQKADPVEGGAERDLVAPWKGQDVVLRLFTP